jgi:hypothetical protein
MKFGTEYLNVIVSRICEFCENRCSWSHILLGGVNEVISTFYINFVRIWKGVAVCFKVPFRNCLLWLRKSRNASVTVDSRQTVYRTRNHLSGVGMPLLSDYVQFIHSVVCLTTGP